MTTKFKSRYVLAVGYPDETITKYYFVNGIIMYKNAPFYQPCVEIKLPKEFNQEREIPKYRLVLERVE